MTMDPSSVADLARALAELTVQELNKLTYELGGVARKSAEEGETPRVVDVFQAITVLLAEEVKRRDDFGGHVDEAMNPLTDLQVPGVRGGLVSEEDDPQA